jgi:hypothetical protein
VLKFRSIPEFILIFHMALALVPTASAVQNHWAEGTSDRADGASRDYYNRAALLKWDNYMGDWRDAKNTAQGDTAYAVATLVDDDSTKSIEWNLTQLVREWVKGKYQNQGIFLRAIRGFGSYHFRSREYGDPTRRPTLIISMTNGTSSHAPVADTYLDPSTYRSLGDSKTLKVGRNSNNALLRFDLGNIQRGTRVANAKLMLCTYAQYGSGELTVGVFRCAQGHDTPASAPILGLASKYPGDEAIVSDPDVIFFSDFESDDWADEWTSASGRMQLVGVDRDRLFEPFHGKAVRTKIAKGSNHAMSLIYKFKKEIGREPEAIYFRYYLRLADDWNQTIQGGKLPGISGTYGVAGWGGRRSDGTNGWSARGAFHRSIGQGNPLAGTHPIGTYCYHADQPGVYGQVWLWQKGYRGYLKKNTWYCIEQYVKMNTPGKKDGIIRAWIDGGLAFEKTDIRFRKVDHLKIEQIWMNVYHGGRLPSPYDQHLYVDNVVIAKRYVGPMKAAAKQVEKLPASD